jgi:hypothetical protein
MVALKALWMVVSMVVPMVVLLENWMELMETMLVAHLVVSLESLKD